MKTTGFGYFLRDTRENAKISLRRLAQETKLDPAYLSRLERELNPAPRQEVVQRIAKALCELQNIPIAECEKLKRDLLDSVPPRSIQYWTVDGDLPMARANGRTPPKAPMIRSIEFMSGIYGVFVQCQRSVFENCN